MANLPTRLKIARYWIVGEGRGTFPKLCFDEVGCFACGFLPGSQSIKSTAALDSEWTAAKLERCHLIADAQGGSAALSNIVLLCARCHRAAPMVGVSPQAMIEWINRRESWVNVFFDGIFAELRALDQALPAKLDALDIPLADFQKVFSEMGAFLKLGYHAGGDTAATVAATLNALIQLKETARRLGATSLDSVRRPRRAASG